MLRVGLTGSISVGKSFVCELFREQGCEVLDSDRTAREVVEPNQKGLHLIVEHFGAGVLTSDGQLDRNKLGAIVFSNSEQLQLLNELLHPLIQERQDKWLRGKELENPDVIAIIDAALLIESGGYKRFDKIVVVWCDNQVQLERLIERDGIDRETALKKINSQLSQEEKKSYADFLIDTSGGFEETSQNTKAVFDRLKEE